MSHRYGGADPGPWGVEQDCRDRAVGHRHDIRSDVEPLEVAGEHEDVTVGRFGKPGEALDQPVGGAVGAECDERMAVGGERLQVDVCDRPDLAVA